MCGGEFEGGFGEARGLGCEVVFEGGFGLGVFSLLELGVAEEEGGVGEGGVAAHGGFDDVGEAGFGGGVVGGEVGALAAAEFEADAFVVVGGGLFERCEDGVGFCEVAEHEE